jgi:Tfp pilus assembly protein FimV
MQTYVRFFPLDTEHPFGHHRSMSRTRVRRRRLLALCIVVSLAGVLSGPVANAVGVGGTGEKNAARTYVVRPGDTLWSIATRFAPSTDPRVVVHALTSANGLDPAALVPGQQLSIPSIG